ncbi:MAG: hypothetical protein DMG03_10970 [Acidobacteria bacterium]|nr:MAG: hypothetical protein DMG03_10970 [Acidobacteriota bacterium]
MNTTFTLTPPVFGFVVATRAALAFGLGLLLADRIPEDRRRTVGLTLVAIGAATTIPAVMSVLGSRRQERLDR